MNSDEQARGVCVEPNCPTCSPAIVSRSTWHLDEVDRVLYGPSVDVCAWCGDSECDGIGCIAALDPDDTRDHPAIEQLHAWIRRGRFAEQVERVLAQCENRPVPPKWGASDRTHSDEVTL